VTKRGSS